MNKCFLLYDSRSGSTLLSALLNRYRGVSVSHETGFVPVVLEHDVEITDEKKLYSLLVKIQNEVQYRELNINHKEVENLLLSESFPIAKSTIIDVILDYYFINRDRDATVYIIKSPRLFHHLSTLMRIYPNVCFIHIIRDGRAVFNSKKSMVSINGIKTQSNLIKAAFDWKKKIDKSKALGDKVFELRYEDLLHTPENVMNDVLNYLEVKGAGRELTKEQGDYSSKIGDKQKHLHANLNKRPDISHANKWKKSLISADIILYESLAGDCLKSRGYQLINDDVSMMSILKPRIFIRVLYYLLHQFILYMRNLWWHAFVDKSLTAKIKSKLFELKSD